MQTDYSKWYQFRKLAIDVVREGFSPTEDGESRRVRGGYCTELFRVLGEPAFGEVVGWQVFGVRGEANPSWHVAHRTAWSQTIDQERHSNPIKALATLGKQDPSIYRDVVTPEADFVRNAYGRLQAIKIPIFVNRNRIGLDGTYYELSMGDGYINATIRWRENAPDEWLEMDAVVKETIAYLEGLHSTAKP